MVTVSAVIKVPSAMIGKAIKADKCDKDISLLLLFTLLIRITGFIPMYMYICSNLITYYLQASCRAMQGDNHNFRHNT